MFDEYQIRGTFTGSGQKSETVNLQPVPALSSDTTVSVVLSRGWSGSVTFEKSTNAGVSWSPVAAAYTAGGVYTYTVAANTVYRLNCTTLTTGSVAYALTTSGLIAAQVLSTAAHHGPSAFVYPEDFGAKGDGVTDDSDSFALATSQGVISLSDGKVYRISANIFVGFIANHGGVMSVDTGKTVMFDGVAGPLEVVCFAGAGKAKPTNNLYSVGWYAGASGNAKWDACRRSMEKGEQKYTVFPVLQSDDPAAQVSGNAVAYKLTAPLIFDDPENQNNIYQYGSFYCAVAGMSAAIEYSPSFKTEDIYWRLGLRIDCGNNAIDGILAHGGARMQVFGQCDIARPIRHGANFTTDVVGVADFSEPKFDFLTCTGMGGQALHIEGVSPRTVLDMSVREVFTNGSRAIWATVTSVSSGAITAISIDANGPNGLAQNLNGFGFPGQTFKIMARIGGTAGVTNTGKGYGGAATPTIGQDGGGNPTYILTGLNLTAGGKYFVANEKVCLTSSDAVVNVAGLTRACEIGKIYEFQDDASNLCPVSDAYMKVVATTGGSSHNLQIGNIATQQGNRRALVVADSSGGTAAKHRILFAGSFAVPAPVFDNIAIDATDNGALVDLQWIEGGYLRAAPSAGAQELVVKLGSAVSNFALEGVDRERALGNGDGVTFDGKRIFYYASSTAIGDDKTVALRYRGTWTNAASVLKTVHYTSNNANHYFIGDIRDGMAQIELAKGPSTTVERINTSSPPGDGYGTDGNTTLSINEYNGYMYLSNRSGGALRAKILIDG